jgi:hypothetical protein
MELMDDDSGLLHHAHTQWPRIRKADLYSDAADVTGRRLRAYLRTMGFPVTLAEQWREQVQHGEENTAQAFGRLRLLLSHHGREGDAVTGFSDPDGILMPRLCSWLEPGRGPCSPWLKTLCDTPPIHRRSMAPEGWDD